MVASMSETRTYRFVALEDSSFQLQARLVDMVPTSSKPSEGTALLRADISTLAYEVINMDSKTIIVSSTSLTVATVLSDTLTEWAVDDIGYNFSWTIPETAFPDASVFKVIITGVTAGGRTFKGNFVFDADRTNYS